MEILKALSNDRVVERKQYQPPLLIQYGSIQDLTEDNTGTDEMDGGDYTASHEMRWGE